MNNTNNYNISSDKEIDIIERWRWQAAYIGNIWRVDYYHSCLLEECDKNLIPNEYVLPTGEKKVDYKAIIQRLLDIDGCLYICATSGKYHLCINEINPCLYIRHEIPPVTSDRLSNQYQIQQIATNKNKKRNYSQYHLLASSGNDINSNSDNIRSTNSSVDFRHAEKSYFCIHSRKDLGYDFAPEEWWQEADKQAAIEIFKGGSKSYYSHDDYNSEQKNISSNNSFNSTSIQTTHVKSSSSIINNNMYNKITAPKQPRSNRNSNILVSGAAKIVHVRNAKNIHLNSNSVTTTTTTTSFGSSIDNNRINPIINNKVTDHRLYNDQIKRNAQKLRDLILASPLYRQHIFIHLTNDDDREWRRVVYGSVKPIKDTKWLELSSTWPSKYFNINQQLRIYSEIQYTDYHSGRCIVKFNQGEKEYYDYADTYFAERFYTDATVIEFYDLKSKMSEGKKIKYKENNNILSTPQSSSSYMMMMNNEIEIGLAMPNLPILIADYYFDTELFGPSGIIEKHLPDILLAFKLDNEEELREREGKMGNTVDIVNTQQHQLSISTNINSAIYVPIVHENESPILLLDKKTSYDEYLASVITRSEQSKHYAVSLLKNMLNNKIVAFDDLFIYAHDTAKKYYYTLKANNVIKLETTPTNNNKDDVNLEDCSLDNKNNNDLSVDTIIINNEDGMIRYISATFILAILIITMSGSIATDSFYVISNKKRKSSLGTLLNKYGLLPVIIQSMETATAEGRLPYWPRIQKQWNELTKTEIMTKEQKIKSIFVKNAIYSPAETLHPSIITEYWRLATLQYQNTLVCNNSENDDSGDDSNDNEQEDSNNEI